MTSTTFFLFTLTDNGIRRTPSFDRTLEQIDNKLLSLQTPAGTIMRWGDISGGANFESDQVSGTLTLRGGPLNLGGQQIKQLLPEKTSGDPSSPTEGEVYYNTAAQEWRGYNGTTWEVLNAGGGGGSSDIPVTHITVSIAGGGLNFVTAAITGWFNDGTLKYMAVRRTAGAAESIRVTMFATAADAAADTDGVDIMADFGAGIPLTTAGNPSDWVKGPLVDAGSSALFVPSLYEDKDSTSSLHLRIYNSDPDGADSGTFELRFVGEASTIVLT